MKVVVTGAAGFLGWHVRCALKARGTDEVVTVDRAEWADPDRLAAAVAGAEVVLHLAGANRGDPESVAAGNERLAHDLTGALDRAAARPTVVFANSVHAGDGSPFGTGKRAAADHLAAWGVTVGAQVADVRLPNLFGEHGRPHYNSVVATFCWELVNAGTPAIDADRELPLLHVQDAVDVLLAPAAAPRAGLVEPAGRPMTVSALLDLLTAFRDTYATGDIPDLTDPLHRALFNTYRSFTLPGSVPFRPRPHADERGALVECLRSAGGASQVFSSTTRPGRTRGEHFHLRKVERFVVLAGTADITLRRLFDDQVVKFAVSGAEPALVDMPTMWAHAITNTGPSDLVTLFWADELFDRDRPDTYPEKVRA